MQGNIDESVNQLQTLLAANPADGKAHLLLCRAYYAEELAEQAVTECEAALQTNNTSEAQDWMGRAYGIKADAAGPIAAYKLARKVEAAFEAAVQLDANNDAAVDDLSEYYVNAPSLLGGGYDKAIALADRVQARLPQPAHRIRALVAERRHDFDTAEQEFRAAVGVSGRADAWSDLGGFYGRRKQDEKAVEALQRGIATDRGHGESTVDAASILYDIRRENRLAEQSLRLYLAGNAKTDAAPAVKVHVILGKLLAEDGDKAGAKIEFNKALELASSYGRAKKALQDL
jgi:Tfp pilus assembly protein PilF